MFEPEKERPKEPLETWIMCKADGATERLADIMPSFVGRIGFSACKINDGYIADVIIGDILHRIRGYMEVLIYTDRTRDQLKEVLDCKDPRNRPPIRRVTEEELEAIAHLPRKQMGGIDFIQYHTEEDLQKKLAEKEVCEITKKPM